MQAVRSSEWTDCSFAFCQADRWHCAEESKCVGTRDHVIHSACTHRDLELDAPIHIDLEPVQV